MGENLSEGLKKSETTHVIRRNNEVWGQESDALGIHKKSDSSRLLVQVDGNLKSAQYIQLLIDNLTTDLDESEIF